MSPRLSPQAALFRDSALALAAGAGGAAARGAEGLLSTFYPFLPVAGRRGQVADISVSSSGPAALRFSVNDSVKRGALAPVLAGLARGLKGGYDLAALDGFMALGRRLGCGFQTTAGVEWQAKQSAPVLKLYYEECAALPRLFRDAAFRKDLYALAGRKAPRAKPEPEIIALDLKPGGGADIKLYCRRAGVTAGRPAAVVAAMRRLSVEERAFYYQMVRAAGGSKIYKVYGPECSADPLPALAEICAFFSALRAHGVLRFIAGRRAAAAAAGLTLVPTICAAGAPAAGGVKADVYFRFAGRVV